MSNSVVQTSGEIGPDPISPFFNGTVCFLKPSAPQRLSGTSLQSCAFMRSYSSGVMGRIVPCLKP